MHSVVKALGPDPCDQVSQTKGGVVMEQTLPIDSPLAERQGVRGLRPVNISVPRQRAKFGSAACRSNMILALA